MVSLRIEDDVSDNLRQMGADIGRLLSESLAMNDAAQILVDEIKAEVRRTFREQTGKLEDSWRVAQVTIDGQQRPTASSDSPYARIQNQGGTILSRGKKLTFPVRDSGVPKGIGPRQYPGPLSWAPTKRADVSRLVDKTKKGRGGGAKTIFLMMDRVTLRATRYLDRAAARAEEPIAERLDRAIQGVIEVRG